MKKHVRIRRNEEFNQILQTKRFVAHPNFVIYSQEAKESISRVGISVSKKLGGAVERNRIKRQVRSMVDAITQYHETFDCVIIVRNGYLKVSYAENLKVLHNLFTKVKSKGS